MTYPLTPPLLDFLILSIVNGNDSYGYEISQCLKEVSTMKDSALYPILRKLSDNNFVDTYDRQFQGRNRKYYRITETGTKQYQWLYQEWQQYINTIEHIINEGIQSRNGEQDDKS